MCQTSLPELNPFQVWQPADLLDLLVRQVFGCDHDSMYQWKTNVKAEQVTGSKRQELDYGSLHPACS